MNQIVKTEAPATDLASMAMITIAPEKYVAALYEPFKNKLTAGIAEADKYVFEPTDDPGKVFIDIKTTAGMEVAKKQRAFFRDEIRLAADKERKDRKAPILRIGELLQSGYKAIETTAEPYESKFDKAIKAEEARKEAERKAKAEAERLRIAGIRADIDTLKRYPVDAAGKPSETIRAMRESLAEIDLTETRFAEFLPEARQAFALAMESMSDQFNKAAAHEADVRRIAEERAALAKAREQQEAEAKAAKEKADQEAAAARAKQEAELQAERDRIAAENHRIAQERAELERQKAELEATKKAAEPPPTPVAEPVTAAVEPPPATDLSSLKPAFYPNAAWPFPRPAAPAEAKPARPTDQDILRAIADHFKVDDAVALMWLTTFDFETAGSGELRFVA